MPSAGLTGGLSSLLVKADGGDALVQFALGLGEALPLLHLLGHQALLGACQAGIVAALPVGGDAVACLQEG